MPRSLRAGWLLAGCLLACAAPSRAAELTVMSFNIEWGGAQVSFEQTVAAIRAAGADLAGVQEPEGNLERLAGALGWNADPRAYVISRYPLLDPPGADGRYVLAEVEPGRVIALASVHLPSAPEGPDAVLAGAGPEQVLELERRVRLPALEPALRDVAGLAAAGMPVFLVGDFNAPAHTDWTPATVGLRPQLRFPLNWPTSVAMQAAGFHDAWRTLYPDPVSSPGRTWWAARPYLERWTPAASDPQDRIDFIWFAGNASVRGVQLAGEAGGPEVSIEMDPWPSDHRSVVGSFEVRPAAMPDLVTTLKRVNAAGEPVEVRYHGPPGAQIRIVDEAGQEQDARIVDGAVSFRLSLPPGRYTVMAGPQGSRMAYAFWVADPSHPASVDVLRESWTQGEGIGVTWRNGPGLRNDYLAIYPAGSVPALDDSGVAWAYVDALPAGAMRFDAETAGSGWPLPPGRYVIRLLEDDGYRVLAESQPFEITEH